MSLKKQVHNYSLKEFRTWLVYNVYGTLLFECRTGSGELLKKLKMGQLAEQADVEIKEYYLIRRKYIFYIYMFWLAGNQPFCETKTH